MSSSARAWIVAPIGTFAMLGARPADGALVPAAASELIQLAGLVLALAGLGALGRSFGVVANRGIKTNGMYRFVRHPLYASYLVVDVGYVLANPSGRNLSLACLATGFQFLRIREEERPADRRRQVSQLLPRGAVPARSRSVLDVRLALVLALVAAVGAAAVAWQARAESIDQQTRLESMEARLDGEVQELRRRVTPIEARLVRTEKRIRQRDGGLASMVARTLKSVFTVETREGALGSAFVAWREGGSSYLVTADHVVRDSPSTFVRISRRGGSWSGEIVGRDSRLRSRCHPPRCAAVRGGAPCGNGLSPRRVHPGDGVTLIGSPFGLEGTVTTGVVSRVTRRAIQTDAAANPGNSGGPAIDGRGRIVGVLVSGAGENVNFAVPIDRVCLELRAC